MKAKEQGTESSKFAGLENETQFGVAKPSHKHAHDAEEEDHSNNTMFSCGSLAPKLKRGGGCMDHGFTRQKEMWELSDGSIFLLRECSKVADLQDFVVSNFENLSNLTYIDHFKHALTLKENLFKSLVVILQSLGKKKMRGHLEMFLEPTFRNARPVDGVETNMSIAAQDFVLEMDRQYGENIFKAIVEGVDDRLLVSLQKIKIEGNKPSLVDFQYPTSNEKMGQGSGVGGHAGQIGVGPEMVMTRAPWAK